MAALGKGPICMGSDIRPKLVFQYQNRIYEVAKQPPPQDAWQKISFFVVLVAAYGNDRDCARGHVRPTRYLGVALIQLMTMAEHPSACVIFSRIYQ